MIGSAFFHSDGGSAPGKSERVEVVIAKEWEQGLTEHKQDIFKAFHPMGTAKEVKLNDVTIVDWKNGRDTNNIADVRKFTVRYTLYWEGIVTSDGFTQIESTFNTEVGRITESKILDTNGTTKSDVSGALSYGAGYLFGAWLASELQE